MTWKHWGVTQEQTMQPKQRLRRMEAGSGVVAETLTEEGWRSSSGQVSTKRHRNGLPGLLWGRAGRSFQRLGPAIGKKVTESWGAMLWEGFTCFLN